MVKGQADWGMYAPKVAGGTMADVGEGAARLGSIVTWDRRGDVELLDDFESPIIRWNTATVGAASSLVLSSDMMRSGSQSLKCTVGILATNSAGIYKNIPMLGPQKIGIEFSFCALHDDIIIILETYTYTGTRGRRVDLRIDLSNYHLSVRDATPAWNHFATYGDFFEDNYAFHSVKIVADLANERHERFIVDGTEYDISAIALDAYNSAIAPRIQPLWWAEARVNGTFIMYLDDFIVTSNEP